MEFFGRYQRQLGCFVLIFLIFVLQGCEDDGLDANDGMQLSIEETENFEDIVEEKVWEPSYELTEDSLLKWEIVKGTETEYYYIIEYQNEDRVYPQIVLKEGRDIFCGTEHLNYLFGRLPWLDYNILYADSHYISLWVGDIDEEMGTANCICLMNINIQCPVTESFILGNEILCRVQDDNDYRNAPWPSNGIMLLLDDILGEIENGNCYLDETAYALWKESPEKFIESVRRQFREIKEGGFEEAYLARYWGKDSSKTYRMYLREGRVGFYIHPLDYWDKYDSGKLETEEDPGDFRIEVAYDWQTSAPVYHMPYEVYGQAYEGELYGDSFGDREFPTFYYPQVRGLDEEIQTTLNRNMEKDFMDNLELMTLEKWNEKWEDYGQEWIRMPPVNNPMVTYQTERYLCIRQDIVTEESDALRGAEGWKRYHVYDLETGEDLKLGDIIDLDGRFIAWLKEEKKVEARTEWWEGMADFNVMVESMKEDLEDYPEELLLSILEDAEFWMKDGNLYVRLPHYDSEYGVIHYVGGGTGFPYYIDYAETRIAVEDIKDFLKVEPW